MHRILLAVLFLTPAIQAQGVPAQLLGRWRVDRVLRFAPTACWKEDRARTLVGSPLIFAARTLRWKEGEVPLEGLLAVSRTLSRQAFAEEYGLPLDSLGIRADRVTEVDLQHEDADVTGATTEVPGDTVVLAGANRIVVSACGVYYEAVRVRR